MMILYDSKINETFNIIDLHIEKKPNQIYSQHFFSKNEYETIILTIPFNMNDYINKWYNSIYDHKTGMCNQKSTYIRDIYICNNVDTKLLSAFPKSISYNENSLMVELFCDYYEFGINFEELRQIHRDKKIDQILN